MVGKFSRIQLVSYLWHQYCFEMNLFNEDTENYLSLYMGRSEFNNNDLNDGRISDAAHLEP